MSILTRAENIVNGREQTEVRKYGPPKIVFQGYANIFNNIAPPGCFTVSRVNENSLAIAITAKGVAYVMKSVKLGREKNHHKEDNLIDDCGYTEIINQLQEIPTPEVPNEEPTDRETALRNLENIKNLIQQRAMDELCPETPKDITDEKETQIPLFDSFNQPLLHAEGSYNKEQESTHSKVSCSGDCCVPRLSNKSSSTKDIVGWADPT